MRVLRRFPRLAEGLRDGRLCLSTLASLGQVLTEENAEELLARAAFRTTAEVDHLVASVKPRAVPSTVTDLAGSGGEVPMAREAMAVG